MGTDGPCLHILLVDDSEDDVLLARRAFSGLEKPHVLHTACCAEEALEYLERRGRHSGRAGRQPDMLLLDLNMPGMGGLELLKRLKADPVLRKIPVVILTTSATQDDVNRCYESGAASYITKPSTMEEFGLMTRAFAHYWARVSDLPSE
ncbi:MAG: response regulator [Elusimicrobia bacterium]|nr:response regulator [Elusimicrobiota bacterium]